MNFHNFWTYRRILLSKRFLASLWRSRKNILAGQKGLSPVAGPYMAELDVTYRCDCRCQMCQRWQDPREGEMTLGEYTRLAEDFRRMGVHLVSVAGGEPLLREDIFSIIRVFAHGGMAVNVCTNGLSLERYAQPLIRSGASCITVSIDGATDETHESIRGAANSHQKIERGVFSLLACSPKERPVVRVRMTICRQNMKDVASFYRKWHGVADDVLLQPVHQCKEAFYVGRGQDLFHLDPDALASQLERTPLRRKNGYMDKLLLSLRQHGTFPVHRCYAGILMARFDPWGNVYPCLEQHFCVGSVRKENFQRIWNADIFNQIRKSIAEDGRCLCWYNNTALISHYAAILGRIKAPTVPHKIRRPGTKTLHRVAPSSNP